MSENKGIFTLEEAETYLSAEPEITAEQLADRLWTATDGVYRTLFIEADNSVIAFDTFGTPGRARAYAKAVSQCLPDKSVSTVIYTHDHLDHAGFAEDFAPEAEIIADEMCAKVIKLREAQGQRLPTRILTGKENHMSLDGVELHLLNPGPTHGSGHLSAWFPDERLLYSSDTILPNARYGLLPDYHLCNFVRFMREFLELDWETFVPGRYEVSDRATFEKGCNYIEAIQEASQQAFVDFVPIWEMPAMRDYVAGKIQDQFGDLDGFMEHVGLTSIRIVHQYLMGGWSLEDTPEARVLLADEVSL